MYTKKELLIAIKNHFYLILDKLSYYHENYSPEFHSEVRMVD